MLTLMLPSFITCLILSGVFVYLGLHIIERQIIFVDLALAQIAALGALTGYLFGVHAHEGAHYFFPLCFALAGALVFSLTRFRNTRVPQEAVIGIVYVVATAASILVLSQSPSEAEHIKHMLVGNILFVQWTDVARIGAICAAAGVFHYLFRGRFLLISTRPAEAEAQGVSLRTWDFLFYASLAFVVTFCVETAGVLLVFSFLVIPAACAMLWSAGVRQQLFAGWGIAVLGSVGGLFCSAMLDLPTGAAVVCVFGVLFALAAIFRGAFGKNG